MNSLKNFFYCGVFGTFLVLICLVSPVQARSPELRLIPADVSALIRESTESARQMETQLQHHVDIFDAKMELYNQTQCQDSMSSGCQEIKRQIDEQYEQMLTLMEKHIPDIKKGISSSKRMLGARMQSQVGRGMTPSQIQTLFNSQNELPILRQSRYALSHRLENYLNLIQNPGDSTSLAEVAALIYLDSDRSIQVLDLIEAQIFRQKQRFEIESALGEVTPEMLDTMSAVKNVIFGEDLSNGRLPAPPASPKRQRFELD